MTLGKLWAAVLLSAAFSLPASADMIPVAGSSSGIFDNATGPAGMIVTGEGTSTFTWGDGSFFGSPPGSLTYTGASFDTFTETFFDVGYVEYFNGTIAAGTEADTVDLIISLAFTNPDGLTETFDFLLLLTNTPNTSDPIESADTIVFASLVPAQTFMINGTAYTLALEVGSTTAGGFSSQQTFSVLEGESATATLRGRITASIPEPSTLFLLGLGALSLGMMRRVNR